MLPCASLCINSPSFVSFIQSTTMPEAGNTIMPLWDKEGPCGLLNITLQVGGETKT